MKEENIRSALESMDKDVLADALAMLLAKEKETPKAVAGSDMPDFANFAQAVLYLKKNYDFSELTLFSTEADLVYITAGDRRVLLTDRSFPNERPQRPVETAEKSLNEQTTKKNDDGRFSHLEI